MVRTINFLNFETSFDEYVFMFIEIPLQVLLGLSSGNPELVLTPTDRIRVEQQAYTDIEKAMRCFESHLSCHTFFASEVISIADIGIFSAFTSLIKFDLLHYIFYPSVFRWFMTTGSTLAKLNAFDFSPVSAKLLKSCVLPEGSTNGKWSRHRTRVKELLIDGVNAIGREVTLKGWVRTARSAEKGKVLFVELNDGSTCKSVQLVLTDKTIGMESIAVSGGVHASISVRGIVVESPAKGQQIEVAVSSSKVLGAVYGGDKGEVGGKHYPLSKKAHSLEFLREKAHLRPRSKVFSAALRIRHAMAYATHKFFNDRGFCYVHTPLITGIIQSM